MRNPVLREIKPNYRRKTLEIVIREGRVSKKYSLPFAVFTGKKIHSKNRFISITIDKELGHQAASYVLEDGTKGDFPADFVLYFCDPTYNWSPINQLKKSIKDKVSASKLSVRVLADALATSPAQVVRLLQENKVSKQLLQLFQLAEIAGYKVEFVLKKKAA